MMGNYIKQAVINSPSLKNCDRISNMAHYKFNPRNHLCSLVWTVLLLIAVTKETKLINGLTCAGLFGLPTVVAGINLREKAAREKRLQIVRAITEKHSLTASQTANMLNIPASEARVLLSQLYRESRIGIGNREEDMTVVYIPVD